MACRTGDAGSNFADKQLKTRIRPVRQSPLSTPPSGSAFHIVVYAAFRMGPALATSRHALTQRVQASAHFRIVSTCLCCPHSAAQASQMSAQTPHSSCANRELDESKLAQTPHTGAHSWQRRIDAAIFEASLRPSSTQAEHQCRHWRHASIAPLISGLETVVSDMEISFRIATAIAFPKGRLKRSAENEHGHYRELPSRNHALR